MIILDTNVVSELARQAPEARVTAWLDSLPLAGVGITAITVAELLYGVSRLPAGRRRSLLAKTMENLVTQQFGGRVWPFDVRAAACYALIVSDRERRGRRISAADAQIAAVCRASGALLATRNPRDFIHTGIELVDPWKAELPDGPGVA